MIAVTRGPGLVGSLLVGIAAAKSLAYAAGKPLVGVNHIEGHIYANFLEREDLSPPPVCNHRFWWSYGSAVNPGTGPL